VRPEWVARPRLLDRLDEALDHHFTFVSAPPGFGKSVLVAQWLERRKGSVAWVSLDPLDNEPEAFVRYLVAALEGASPVRFSQTGGLLAARQPPPFRYLCDVFVSELARVEDPLVVVLEDYHAVSSEDVHRLLERLVPALSPVLHLVVLTRRDPPLPLGHWRAQDWLLELRGRDLRVSLDEARTFFASGQAVSLSESTVETLLKKTEGWIAGLRLVKLSLRGAEDPESRAREFSGSNRLVADYLTAELIAAQPPETRELLVVTAPLPRFCASLCDHLLAGTPHPPAREGLSRLEQDNMFMVPLDGEGRWYRYHHLFQELLLHHLPDLSAPDRRAEIHRRAGAWFAREGLVEEALRHWIEAGDLDAAAALLGEHILDSIDEDIGRAVLSRWVSLFPAGAEHGRLPLLIARGYLRIRNWDVNDLAGLVAEAETCLATASPGAHGDRANPFRVDVEAQKAFLLYWRGDPEGALQAASRVLDLLSARSGGIARTLGVIYKVGGLAMTGRRRDAVALLEQELREAAASDTRRLGELFAILGFTHLYAADLASADAQARRALVVHETTPIPDYWLGHVLQLGAAVSYERNRLDDAAAGFRRVITLRYRTSTRICQEALIGLCLIAKARGDRAEAARHCAEARAFALQMHDPTGLALADSLEARLALDGDGVAPSASAASAAQYSTYVWLEVPPLTWAERLVADPSLGGPGAALAYIEEGLEAAESRHNVKLAIPFAILRALALDHGGDRGAALTLLEATVDRAEPLGLVRTFADRDPRVATLLEQLAARVGREGYVGALLDACRGADTPPRVAPSLASWDQLSNREMQVLELLAERLANKEIAERLHISVDTVKNHTASIYSKLNVHGRRQAVAKALAEGLVSPRPWHPRGGPSV
jgi:LuxR family maltose regulon positive regulatory protein